MPQKVHPGDTHFGLFLLGGLLGALGCVFGVQMDARTATITEIAPT